MYESPNNRKIDSENNIYVNIMLMSKKLSCKETCYKRPNTL